ncbi:MAG: HIT domain-containing protein [Patescibacteria group bacterium]
MEDCIFCQIVAKKIPARIFWQNDEFLVFYEIKPRAPLHLLVIPKKHLVLDEVGEGEANLLANLILTAKKVAEKAGLSQGYRLVINNGRQAGQEVDHLHLHLLGGGKLAAF